MQDLKDKLIIVKPETPLIGGEKILIEDTCEKVFDDPDWMFNVGNYAIMQFLRLHPWELVSLKQCYYGKVGDLGYIVTEDELDLGGV